MSKIGSQEWKRSKPWQRKYLLIELEQAESTLAAIAKLPDEWRNTFNEEHGFIDASLTYKDCANQLEVLIK